MGDTEEVSQEPSNGIGPLGVILFFLGCLFLLFWVASKEDSAPNIEIASMDFTVRNITQTRLGANWDLLIRVPRSLPDNYICLQGDIRASLFYKNITLATSSGQRYHDLKSHSAQQLRVSAAIYDEDIGGLVGKNIIEDIKAKRELKFGSQLFLTDCRKGTTGVMSYACDETTLRFEPGSETKAIKFGKNPTCTNF